MNRSRRTRFAHALNGPRAFAAEERRAVVRSLLAAGTIFSLGASERAFAEAGSSSCPALPQETSGPFPADGSDRGPGPLGPDRHGPRPPPPGADRQGHGPGPPHFPGMLCGSLSSSALGDIRTECPLARCEHASPYDATYRSAGGVLTSVCKRSRLRAKRRTVQRGPAQSRYGVRRKVAN